MELKKICDWLDDVFKDYKCEKDMSNNGVQVAGTPEVKRIAFAVDACLETIEKAAEGGADMLFVHHGLSWKEGFKRLTGNKAERFRKLFQSNLSLYALHLPLDSHEELGNNAVLAKWLNLNVTKRFYDYHGIDIGMLCKLDAPMLSSELLERVRCRVSPDAKLIDNSGGVINCIALIAGGGDFDFDIIRNAGADCLVTGEVRHKWWHDAQEANVSLISAGHYATEVTGVQALMAKVSAELQLETFFIDAPTGF